MFGIGMNEMLLILIIAVVIIGPKQLPAVARGLGKMMAQFKRATNDLKNAVNEEVGQQIQMEEIRQIKASLDTDLMDFQSTARNYIEGEFSGERETVSEFESTLHSAIYENPVSEKKKPARKKTAAKKASEKKASVKKTSVKKATAPAKAPAKTTAKSNASAKKATGTGKGKRART